MTEATRLLQAAGQGDARAVVKLRFFVGLKQGEIASALGMSEETVQCHWTHAKAWLYVRVKPG